MENEQVHGPANKKMPTKKISAGGVVLHKGKVLLIYWKSRDKWELPKGTNERGESLEDTCIREMMEETGYNVKIIDDISVANFQFTWDDDNTYDQTICYYLMILASKKKLKHSRESHEDFINKWVDIDKAETIVSYDNMQEAIRKAIFLAKKRNLL